MFPAGEDAGYKQPSADITGIEQIFSRVSDWVEPGVGANVFPDSQYTPLEDGVDLDDLLAV